MRLAAAILISFFVLTGTSGAALFSRHRDLSGVHTVAGISVQVLGVSKEMHDEVDLVLEQEILRSGDAAPGPPLADDLAFFVSQHYLTRGYADVRTEWDLEGATVVLTVSEGKRQTIGQASFPGADAVPHDELRQYLTRETKEREGRAVKDLPFVRKDIEAGARLVERRLQNEGYLNAAAAEPQYTLSADGTNVAITVEVQQGDRFRFGAFQIEGSQEPISKIIAEKVNDLSGQPFSEVKLKNLEKEIKGAWQARGWFAAQATALANPEALPHGGDVPVRLLLTSGNRYRVTDVQFADDFSHGGRRIVTSVLSVANNHIYSPAQIDLLHRRALDTGVFSRLDVEPEISGPDTLTLKVSGREAKPKTLGIYGGYETFSGPILGFETKNVNFLNSGNSVGLRAEGTGRGFNGSLQLVDPAIFRSRNSFTGEVLAQTFNFQDEYERQTIAARATLTRRLNRRITAELFAGLSLNSTSTSSLTPDELGPESYDIASGGARLTFDFRDHPLNPRKGWLASLAVEAGQFGGDADFSFVRPELSVAWYRPIAKKFRFAIGARAAFIQSGVGVEDIPIDSRLFNGGATSVRSFPEREMGPMSKSSVPLGGTVMRVASAELSYEIIKDLEIAAFVDAGSLSNDNADLYNWTNSMRYAIGAGIRYKLPVGPLRLDYGFNPDPRNDEPHGAFHLTFGFAF